MKHLIRRLDKTIEIEGQPVLGLYRASVSVGPPDKNLPLSWILKTNRETRLICSDSVISCRMQNLAVWIGNQTRAHVLEHLLPLRVAGLLGATISSSHCLPYFGNTTPFLQQIIPHCIEKYEEVPTYTVNGEHRWTYPKLRGNQEAFTSLGPRKDGLLVIDVTISYPNLGVRREVYTFPNDYTLARIAKARSQGWPPKRYALSKLAGGLGIWKHHHHADWPQELGIEQALSRFTDHRCLDILGAFGTLMNGGFLSGHVVSVCSGHDADMHVCRAATRDLTTL